MSWHMERYPNSDRASLGHEERWLVMVPSFTQPGFLGLFVQIKCESGRKNTYYAHSWLSPSSALFASLAEWSGFMNFSTFQLC